MEIKFEKIIREMEKVILLHGFNPKPKAFDKIRAVLRSKNIRIHNIKYDSHKAYEDWIKAIDSKLSKIRNKEDLYVIGHSLGGSLALHLCKKYKFKGLIAINSPIYVRRTSIIKFIANALLKYKKIESITIRNIKYTFKSFFSLLTFLDILKQEKPKQLNSALIIQSKRDWVVHKKSAEFLYNKIESENKQILRVGSGHTPLNQPSVLNSITGFMGVGG